jgi:hypothetical protein
MNWKESKYGSKLRSLLTSSSMFRQIPSSRAGIFGIWIFVSVFLLLVILHPLSPVKSGLNYSFHSKEGVTSILDNARNSTLGVSPVYWTLNCFIHSWPVSKDFRDKSQV